MIETRQCATSLCNQIQISTREMVTYYLIFVRVNFLEYFHQNICLFLLSGWIFNITHFFNTNIEFERMWTEKIKMNLVWGQINFQMSKAFLIYLMNAFMFILNKGNLIINLRLAQNDFDQQLFQFLIKQEFNAQLIKKN